MSLRINTNVDALTAYRNLNSTQSSMSTSLERLSSGLRINKAADDAAGLAISQGLTAQINGLTQASRNAQDGINVVQTADGALTETQSILQRMNTLGVQAANDSNDSNSRADIQTEITALNSELDRISSSTSFNGVKLLDGTFNNKAFQVGATSAAYDQIGVSITSGSASQATTTITGSIALPTSATDGITLEHDGVTTTVDTTALTGDYSGTGANDHVSADKLAKFLNDDSGFAANYSATVKDGALNITAKDGLAGEITTTGISTTTTAAKASATFAPGDFPTDFNASSSPTALSGSVTLKFGDTELAKDVDVTGIDNGDDLATKLRTQIDASKYSVAWDDTDGLTISSLDSVEGHDGDSFSLTASGTSAMAVTTATGVTNQLTAGTATSSAPVAASGGFSAQDLGTNTIDMTTQKGAEAALDTIATALQNVSTARANLGALQNRFQHTINNLSVTTQNLQASNSSITDTDMAAEMSNFTRAQILSQAGTSMLKQANQASQSVLSLLQ